MRSSRDQLQISFQDTDIMVAEAIAYLQKHEPPEGYYVGFSGGKDSICTKKICDMAGVKYQAFYSCTRIDPPEVVQFIKKYHPDVEVLLPKMTFWAGIKKKAPPLRMVRWCCDVLKKDPGKDHPLKNRVMGIRAEESARRAARPRQDYFKKYKQTIYKPIFGWNEYHVWDFIEKNNLPYPALYDQGFHRLGCVICPFMMGSSPGKKAAMEESMRRWPGMWKAFENSCREWFMALRNDELRPGQKHKTFEAYYAAYLNGFEGKERAPVISHEDEIEGDEDEAIKQLKLPG